MKKKALAEHIAADEAGKNRSQLTDQEIKRIVVSLHKYHLPHLAEGGYVSWNRETNMVEIREKGKTLIRATDENGKVREQHLWYIR